MKTLRALLISYTLTAALSGAAAAQSVEEYKIKAVFVFNFTQFVQWPDSAFSGAASPFIIGVLGNNPFKTYLEETVRGESVNGHPLTVKYYRTAAEAHECHILYINLEDKDQMMRTFDGLKGKPVLTVGDMIDFARKGGMIRFITEQNKTRLRINLTASKNAGLNISSKLLRLAEIVESQPY